MSPAALPPPEFGTANLSNCEREQIQFAGSIQPHGALLVMREEDMTIVQASANAAAFLGVERELIGCCLSEVDGDLLASIKVNRSAGLHSLPVAIRCRIGPARTEFDCLLHRIPNGGLIAELEPAGPPVDLTKHAEMALNRIVGCASIRALADEVAQIFKELTGYDRVMVYRFDEEGHGEVLSEQRKPELEAFLGNRYPASDIPQIARRLYERNRVRVLRDVGYSPVPLKPRLSPLTGRDLDMSLCFLRSFSPIHIQYLKNMGVGATLVVSLMAGGRLWGLVACHHYEPRFVHFEVRAVCELLAEACGTRITALESFVHAQAELFARRLEQRMIEAVSRDGDWRTALFDGPEALLQSVAATGAALIFDGRVSTCGEVPGTQEIKDIAARLSRKSQGGMFATASLGLDEPDFAAQTSVASGVMGVPVSASPGEYLLWFRQERVRTVTWGGDPLKAVVVGDDPADLSPRRSFAKWHQVVEGTGDPWTPSDLHTGRLIGRTVGDVVTQFRSVRMLIAQDQLESISRQLQLSDQPVITSDPLGRILLTNEAFERLLPAAHRHLLQLDDLALYFADPVRMRHTLSELVARRRSWRGEVTMTMAGGEGRPMLMRADPVLSPPDQTLGFVLLLTDLTEQKAAEAARRRFQEDLFGRAPVSVLRADTKSNLLHQNVLSSAMENAQLAALEITYGVDVGEMPNLLESVRASVARTADILDHLLSHVARSADHDA